MTQTPTEGQRPHRLPSRATTIRELRLVPARVRFDFFPGHISAPPTHLDLVDLSPPTVIQLHALVITANHLESGDARHGPQESRPTAPIENTSSIDAGKPPSVPAPMALQPDVTQTSAIHSYNGFPPRPLGGYSNPVEERGGELSPVRGTVKHTHTPS